jgi:hypothetical protein
MVKLYVFLVILICIGIQFHDGRVGALSSQDGSEEWGYVPVRPSKPNALELSNFNYNVFKLLNRLLHDITKLKFK